MSSGRLSLIFLRYRKVRTDRIGMYTRYRWEHVLPRRVNCSGKTGNLPSLPVILSGTCRVPGDEFQGRRRFSNNARRRRRFARSIRVASYSCSFRFRRRLGADRWKFRHETRSAETRSPRSSCSSHLSISFQAYKVCKVTRKWRELERALT